MHDEYATFGLTRATRTGGVLPGGVLRSHREFLDFVVDGRPLLLRLDDVDAISPLAADLGPTVFTAHVRRLLLDAAPPLAGGRYVVYGCPECEGLDCGAVTAVIEREDEHTIVWRDFAWQTDETADLERNGYPGVGPFRFRVEEYRAQLERLLTEGEAEAAPRRVLLVGRRASVLNRTANALRQIGVSAEISHEAPVGASPDELRSYGAVLVGRGLAEDERTAIRGAFEAAGARAAYVEGLAPVIPVLVAQTEQALDHGESGQRQLAGLEVTREAVTVTTDVACRVQLTVYRLDRLYRTRARELCDAQLEPGRHRLDLDGGRGGAYVVARAPSRVLVAAVPD
ncbi:oxidoreductase [Streptomyces sp. AJS327]|uniref:oxidoreductase n=1 Tax=Streptomyces sp. AJS327 TaxID=2545265 RepID=UPI0015DEC513|nr:oxidoreductase [Streptomyces sp. AJS327]MBA0052268.1 oxidoreductase [Streptomyces sp. AJS327]